MAKKKLNTEPVLLTIAIIVLIAFAVVYLVVNKAPSEQTTTTTTIPEPEQEIKYIPIDALIEVLPENTESFEGSETGGAIQKIRFENDDGSETRYSYSIASKKYRRKSDGKMVEVVLTDTLGVDKMNGFFFNLIPLNLTWGYVQPREVKGYPAWVHFEYGKPVKEVGFPRLDVAVNERVIVTLTGEKSITFDDLYEIANAIDWQQLEIISGTFVRF